MDYGKIIRLTYDGKVYNVASKEKTQFRLINIYEEFLYPTDVTYGATENEVYLYFDDFNLFGANRLECLQCISMGSDGVSFSAFVVDVFLDNLTPSDNEYLELGNIECAGEIVLSFDGKAYFDDTYLQLVSVAVAGEIQALTFVNGYLDENATYLELASISVAGQYCDINGVPL